MLALVLLENMYLQPFSHLTKNLRKDRHGNLLIILCILLTSNSVANSFQYQSQHVKDPWLAR